jgi:hypothetical protein
MSSKCTIFLTNDNEHCYEDVNQPFERDGKLLGYTITLEMCHSNARLVANDEDGLCIEIDPGSELYERIKMMKGGLQ